MSLSEAPAEAAPLAPVKDQAATRPWQVWASWTAIALGLIPRIWAAIWDQSIFWPDEIHQTLEQAHRFAFGRGMLPWEFRQAARSWVFPGVLGLYLKLLALLGVAHSRGFVIGAKLLMVAMGLVTAELCRRLAVRLAGQSAGLIAAMFVSACPMLIFFGARTMTEMASAPLLIGAAYALEREKPLPALSGALVALSIYLRYQNGIVAVGLLVLLWVRKSKPELMRYAIALGIVGVLGGMLDWVTWKYPFQAFWEYVDFNLIKSKGAPFGASPPGFFAEYLSYGIGAALGVLLLGFGMAWKRARGLVTIALAYFVVHSIIPHKELRFILPIIPLFLALAAAGFAEIGNAAWKSERITLVVALATSIAMGVKAIAPRQSDYARSDSSATLWHLGEDYFVTEWEAEKHDDVCGIAMIGNQPWWTGGYTYFHRDVNIYLDANHLNNVNYVIGGRGERLPSGWKKIYEHQQYALFRRDGTCAPDPHYQPNLN